MNIQHKMLLSETVILCCYFSWLWGFTLMCIDIFIYTYAFIIIICNTVANSWSMLAYCRSQDSESDLSSLQVEHGKFVRWLSVSFSHHQQMYIFVMFCLFISVVVLDVSLVTCLQLQTLFIFITCVVFVFILPYVWHIRYLLVAFCLLFLQQCT